jgi:Domain of unknown function (DUF4350)
VSPPRSRAGQALAVVVVLVLAVNLVGYVLERTRRTPGGPPSSAYATAPEGLAAYADLLARAGHPVVQLRDRVEETELSTAATVVLLEPDRVSDEDARELRRFVQGGGRLVAGGADPTWLAGLLDRPPTWSPAGLGAAEPVAPVAEVDGLASVAAAGGGSWSDTGEALPALAGEDAALLAVAGPGEGRLLLLADASVLQNRLLGSADNAALGLALAGEEGRPVAFVESVHGYGSATGLRAIPRDWIWALAGLAAAALLFLWARGRRLGPPERAERELPPARREYVDSLAAALARTRDPAGATAPVRAAARERLARRAGLDHDADTEALRVAAERAGLRPDETAAILGDAGDVMAAGRALARLERETRR